ncbi:Hint domain-containing protein, partial [Roseicyclus sp.]|uniref:Hint domain-containing protein n=1 Tax=Roseicyclus sp. TaxID=1914329 RepID=UPI001BCF9B19
DDSQITINISGSLVGAISPPGAPSLGTFMDLGNGEFSVTYNLDVLNSVLITPFHFSDTFEVNNNDPAAPEDDVRDTVTITFHCFAMGTAILTPDGMTPVETLSPGSLVATLEGRFVPVRFNFRQIIATRFHMAERLQLVRVRAGALGSGVPARDLVLTADHALMIDGLLINAGALVNGTTIDCVRLAELGDSFTVYHVETDAHDIILAEGTPTETYIDYAGRQGFDNYADYIAFYGEGRMIPEHPAPRVTSARQLPPALRARLGIVLAA